MKPGDVFMVGVAGQLYRVAEVRGDHLYAYRLDSRFLTYGEPVMFQQSELSTAEKVTLPTTPAQTSSREQVPSAQARTSPEQQVAVDRPPTTSFAPSTYASSNYAGLRGIASLCTGLGWVILILAGISAIGGLLSMPDSFSGVGIAIVSVLTGGLSFIILRVIAESISVLLDIEANTRRAAMILDQRLK